jgi:cysteine desulfurase
LPPNRLYIDSNATAKPFPEVLDAVARAMAELGNASSIHSEGRVARSKVETARIQVAELIGAAPDQVIFTSGGSEANAMALRGLRKRGFETPSRVAISATEHICVFENSSDRERVVLPVDEQGAVVASALENFLAGDTTNNLVSIHAANNETGVLHDLSALAQCIHGRAIFHTDAVQALGKIPLDFKSCGVDAITLSAHKMGGVIGAGALVISPQVQVTPLIRGGGQERGLRAGTENIAAIVGFGVAAERAKRTLDSQNLHLKALRDAFEKGLCSQHPECAIFAVNARRLPNTTCFALPRLSAEVALMALDLKGIAVSSGSACSSGKVRPSHVLAAMGVHDSVAKSAIRVSWGWHNTESDVQQLLDGLRSLHRGVS